MAHLALARAKQGRGKLAEAAGPLARAREVASGVTAQEASGIDALGLLAEGKGSLAYPKIRAHVAEHPRDVLLAQTCTSVFGLIGFSGIKRRIRSFVSGVARQHRPAFSASPPPRRRSKLDR